MKIAYLGAGAAGRYCGACLHDNTLATALGKLGEEILLIPTYTPLRTDEHNVSHRRVFFGGVNVYLVSRFAVRLAAIVGLVEPPQQQSGSEATRRADRIHSAG
jgi:hypothetical protein